MTLTSKILKYIHRVIAVFLVLGGLLSAAAAVNAQETLVLSVSPTLFEMTANKNQNWSSSVRVINANPYPITVYAEAVNFAASGEDGLGTLMPVFESAADGQTLAEWINVTSEEIVIAPEQTISVPFTISVPEDATPGGHFAAILIGTRPLAGDDQQAQVETSQVVTSLVFLRVAGDIIESGQIREFTTTRRIYEYPEATFGVRFENTGSVHLQPQGEIEITNMWGNERGVIPVNQHSQFGNVLPDSIRNYTFTWAADWSWADIGRNKAVISLAYGDEARQFAAATTYFWVIPWKFLLFVMVVIGVALAIIVWGIKLYVRKMLQLAGVTPELQRHHKVRQQKVSVTAPLEAGILDLRSELQNGEGSLIRKLLHAATRYKAFTLVVGALVIFVGLLVWYVILIVQNDFNYTVQYEQPDGSVVDILVADDRADDNVVRIGDGTVVRLVNHSNNQSLSETVADKLREQTFKVTLQRELLDTPKTNTVIVYDPEYLDAVERITDVLPGALVSAYVSEDDSEPPIIIYLGTDQE